MSRLIVSILLAPALVFGAGADIDYSRFQAEGGNVVISYSLSGFASAPGSRTLVDDDGLVSVLILHSIIADNAKVKYANVKTPAGLLNVEEWNSVRAAYKASLLRLQKFYQDQNVEIRAMTDISEERKNQFIQAHDLRIAEINRLIRETEKSSIKFGEFNEFGTFFNEIARHHQYTVRGTRNGDSTIGVMEALFKGRGFKYPDELAARCYDTAKGDVAALASQLVAALNRKTDAGGTTGSGRGGE